MLCHVWSRLKANVSSDRVKFARRIASSACKADDARRRLAIRFRTLLLPEKATAQLTSSVGRDKLPRGQRARALSVNFPYHNARVCPSNIGIPRKSGLPRERLNESKREEGSFATEIRNIRNTSPETSLSIR